MVEDLRRELDECGFVVVTDVLPDEDLARLRFAFAHAPPTSGTQHVDIDDATPHAEAWRALVQHPLVLDLTRRIVPAPRFRIHGRNPRPGYGQQGLHADAPPRRAGEPAAAVTAIWMVDDFTSANGATRVVPGSHVRHTAVPRHFADPDAHHPDERTITGRAGTVLVLNGHLWHSGTRNRTTGPRRAVQMTARRSSAASH